MNSQFQQVSLIQDPYSMFQVSQQEEEPMDSNRSMENLIQSENKFCQSINRLEVQMSNYINTKKDRNEETLPNTYSTIPDCPSLLIGTKNLGVLETLIKTQFHHTNLNLTNFKPWTNWQVFHSMRLNLNMNVTLIPNLVIQFSILT